jgi:thiamine kinase-like enzyme
MASAPLPRAADAENLTAAFRRCGVLGSACVANVSLLSSLKKLRSHTFRLRLDYDGPANDAPDTVIVKVGHLDDAGRPAYTNRHEIAFYRQVAPTAPAGLVPPCFEVVEATETTPWHLLLEDLTDSHFIATEWPLPPTFAQCESIVRALARFHAAWWDHPCLGGSVGSWLDPAAFAQVLREYSEKLDRFVDRFGESLPPERHDLYRQLLDQAPRLLARYHSHRDHTITHGDAHAWNFFLPRDGVGDGVRLIDWESWSIDAATDDLAYMMGMLWFPDRRRRMERLLLDRYHATLVDNGIGGYDRRALQNDYRLSVLWSITRPIGQAANNIPPRVWWHNLERIMLAVDDLGCRDLLG